MRAFIFAVTILPTLLSCGPPETEEAPAEVTAEAEAMARTPADQEAVVLPPTEESRLAAESASIAWTARQLAAADLPPEELRGALLNFGYVESELEVTATQVVVREGGDNLWRTRNHIFGYIPTSTGGSASLPLQNAFGLDPDLALRGKRITVTLDRVRIERYPGKGLHDIAFSFHAQTQAGRELIPLAFNVGLSARSGDEPAIAGKSIFVGLNVGTEGVDLKGSTTNVNSSKDKNFFSVLAGSVFEQGLRLIPTVQPALQPLTALAEAVTAELQDGEKGILVQLFDLGLDLSQVSSRIHLREGSYVVIQIPPGHASSWNWSEWEFRNGRIQRIGQPAQTVPYNYVILGISEYHGA